MSKKSKKTEKKVVDMTSDRETPTKTFKPSEENKKKATSNRIIALILWAIAIGLEVYAITRLNVTPVPIGLLIGLIIGIAVLAITGSLLWRKANRLDPASEEQKVKFFIQNQLGLILSIIAFLPLIILLLMNKDLEGKDKGIVTGIAVVALLVAGFFGFESNPVSIEQYTAETARVESLMGEDHVYWTKHGSRYHLFEDCHHINREGTVEIYKGKVVDAYEHKHIDQLCKTCENRAAKWLEDDENEENSEENQEENAA